MTDQHETTTDQRLLNHILIISRQMAETRRLNPLLAYVITEAIELVGAEQGYIVLVNPDGSLDFRVKQSRDGRIITTPEDQISTTVLNQVIDSGQPLVVRNAVNDSRFADAESVVILQLRSIMCVPLVAHGETIGAIYVENRAIRSRFSEEDVAPLVLFANQAAIALENAALNDELGARVAARTRELEEAKAQLEQSWAAAVEANRLRTVWLSQIAHDLRAPLGIAAGALGLILDGTLGQINEEQQEWGAKSMQAIHHAASLTNDVFDLARLDEGKISLQLDRVDLDRLLQRIYEMGLGLPWQNGVDFKLEILSPLPWIDLDASRLEQILLNLLSNAQKFTEQGQVLLQARHLPGQQEVHINVKDTGQGIPADQLEQMFSRFHRIKRPKSEEKQGTGLGLAICRELVEMHGGRIWVESEPNVGSNFIFALSVPSE